MSDSPKGEDAVMTTGEKIRELRRLHNMTQEELGAQIGVQKAAIQKYEKGTVKNIKRESLIKLSQILQTTPEYLLGWDELPSNLRRAEKDDTVSVPIIGRVAAGLSCFAESNIVDYETVNASDISSSESYVYLRVTGDSMYPIFMENDLVLIQVESSVDSGTYGVVTIDNEDGVIKQIVYGSDYIELRSVNPLYPPRRFEGRDVERIRVFGAVKEVKRKF